MFFELFIRDLRSRFIGSYTGWLWLLINPLLLLAVYAFVFGFIFRARVPEGMDVAFVVWLAIGLWPWLAFSEAILRASESMPQYRNLISKVAVPRELLTLSSATAAFVLQVAGYLVVLLLIWLLGSPIRLSGFPNAVFILVILFMFSCGIGLVFAALRVYLRDLEQLLPTLLMFGFFLTPIIYAPEMLPDELQFWTVLNPMASLLTALRAALLEGRFWPDASTWIMGLVALAVFMIGLAFFRRLSPYFEDFL